VQKRQLQETQLEAALTMAANGGRVLVITADTDGKPHLTTAGSLVSAAEGRLRLAAWFDPVGIENLNVNPWLAVIVEDLVSGEGFHVAARVEHVDTVAEDDGDDSALPKVGDVPGERRELLIVPETVLVIANAPHRTRGP
jgi:hypothetical protein